MTAKWWVGQKAAWTDNMLVAVKADLKALLKVGQMDSATADSLAAMMVGR